MSCTIVLLVSCPLQDQEDRVDDVADNIDLAARNTRGGAINLTQVYCVLPDSPVCDNCYHK